MFFQAFPKAEKIYKIKIWIVSVWISRTFLVFAYLPKSAGNSNYPNLDS